MRQQAGLSNVVYQNEAIPWSRWQMEDEIDSTETESEYFILRKEILFSLRYVQWFLRSSLHQSFNIVL
jgi:hypothetical protein